MEGAPSSETHFPGIALLEDNIYGQVEISIVTVRTDDGAVRGRK